jgi:hypothetical protein
MVSVLTASCGWHTSYREGVAGPIRISRLKQTLPSTVVTSGDPVLNHRRGVSRADGDEGEQLVPVDGTVVSLRTVRHDCLDNLLVVSRSHLESAPAPWARHYNAVRPRRGLQLVAPIPRHKPQDTGTVRHHDVLGG